MNHPEYVFVYDMRLSTSYSKTQNQIICNFVFVLSLLLTQYMQMAQHLGVSQAYKPDSVSQVQPRGVSMIMSSDAGPVPYGHMMPQLATLQINSPVIL